MIGTYEHVDCGLRLMVADFEHLRQVRGQSGSDDPQVIVLFSFRLRIGRWSVQWPNCSGDMGRDLRVFSDQCIMRDMADQCEVVHGAYELGWFYCIPIHGPSTISSLFSAGRSSEAIRAMRTWNRLFILQEDYGRTIR